MAREKIERDILPVTVGTAGHIDHGKTTLLRALAGEQSDTDRLSEERERGLTIDVGYAEIALDDGLEVGVVDVPGHERFIRNMVAGATGIDVVVLVVAADDGVMPQTREHLQIMSLLGLTSGVIALTKVDTVDAEMAELVGSEVEDLVAGTFLDGAKLIPVSGISGQGIEELRTEIARLVRAAPGRDVDGFFRMPVLRVFTSPGFGTVVTGIPASGRIEVGERVLVRPGQRPGRVRGLQVYHRAAEHAAAGHRTAINLAELEHKKVRRGDVVCDAGVFDETQILDVKLHVLPTVPRPLRHNQEARLHVGTLECAARVLVVSGKHIAAGETAWARLKLDRHAVVAPGDRFILRASSHLITLGGGIVLGAGSFTSRRRRGALAAEFEERERGLHDLGVAVEAQLRRARLEGTTRDAIVRALLRRKEEIEPELERLIAADAAVDLGRSLLLHGDEVRRGEEALVEALERFHAKQPLALGMRKALLSRIVQASPAVTDGLLDRLRERGVTEPLAGGQLRLAGHGAQTSAAQTERMERIVELLAAEPWQTPKASELPRLVSGLPAEVEQLLTILDHQGRIVRLSDGIVLAAETVEEAKARVREHCATETTLTPADLKRLVGATRKYGIPLLEHLDAVGFTRRQGDVRVLRTP